jgi:hypothetical protein
MNLTELTQYVWNQTDTTEFDLPASTIASYIDEAFNRTIAAENRWPSYEKTWSVVVPVGSASSVLDSDVNRPAVVSVTNTDTGWRLEQISEEEADLRFGSDLEVGGSFSPGWYSFWSNRISFWPRVAADEETIFSMRGYRKPLTTFADTGQVDADPRLHRPLAHYAVALAYAQQEDEVLERTYMERWQRDVELARRAIMDASHNRPVIMNGNFPRTPVGGYRGYVPPFSVTINAPGS